MQQKLADRNRPLLSAKHCIKFWRTGGSRKRCEQCKRNIANISKRFKTPESAKHIQKVSLFFQRTWPNANQSCETQECVSHAFRAPPGHPVHLAVLNRMFFGDKSPCKMEGPWTEIGSILKKEWTRRVELTGFYLIKCIVKKNIQVVSA